MVRVEMDEAARASDGFRFAAEKMMETSRVALFAASGGYRPVVNAILNAAKRGKDEVAVNVSDMGDDIRRSLRKTLIGMGLHAGYETHNIHISNITSWYSDRVE